VELEDEDGGPVRVTAEDLMRALKHAGRPVPLIVLSSCSRQRLVFRNQAGWPSPHAAAVRLGILAMIQVPARLTCPGCASREVIMWRAC
jgi:hypothetical protein